MSAWLTAFVESVRSGEWWAARSGLITLFGVNLAHPEVLLLLVPIVFWLWWTRRQAARQRTIPYSRADILGEGPKPAIAWVSWLPYLRALALAGLVVAVAQPRSGARAERVSSEGIDIALVVDISSSMLAEDFQPQNRMEVAKEKVKRFVLGRKSDRVGLVAFSGEALTQVPLTTDYPVVLAAIDNLAVGQLEDGTAIGTAIATAANRLRNSPGRSRVMVLLTDGENNRGAIDPRTAAQAAGTFGVRIYAIGVGTDGMAAVPVGRGLFGLRYENRPVKIDEPLLTEIATTTGGRYFRARDAAALQDIYEQIDQLERSAVEAKSFIRYTERFRWPLVFGLVALLSELWIRARRGLLP
jgi:Ca-activated chloride channel family protein